MEKTSEPLIPTRFWVELAYLTFIFHFLYSIGFYIGLVLVIEEGSSFFQAIGIIEQVLLYIKSAGLLLLYIAPIPIILKILIMTEKKELIKSKVNPKYAANENNDKSASMVIFSYAIYIPFYIGSMIYALLLW